MYNSGTGVLTTYEQMAPDVSAFLPGCPSLVIERTLRKIAIDLCQRAKVWRLDAVPVPLVVGTPNYTLSSPVAYGEVTDILDAYTLDAAGAKVQLEWKPLSTIQQWYPSWPQDNLGQPVYITRQAPSTVLLAPVPQDVATLYATVAVRPTAAATGIESWLYSEFSRVLFHGSLHELMMMPERSWSDEKKAAFHGKQWTYLLSAARDRASRDFNVGSLAVEMRPFA